MAHAPYTHILPDSDTAVIFIHGILGTPDHFLPFLSLIPEDISVVNLLLDGHGKGVREFSRTSMAKWEAQVDAAVDAALAAHQKVFLVAHSLGSLLAIEQAVKKPVAGLFLLAVPIRLRLRFRIISTSWKVYTNRIADTDTYATAAKNCCGVQMHKNPLLYLGWIPRFLELFSKIRETRTRLKELHTPCCAYQSADDELVRRDSAAYLKTHSAMEVFSLENSSHYYYDPSDMAFLQQEFSKLL